MSWTYSGNPATSDRDATRFLLGDTDASAQQIQDEEIDWLLTQEKDPYSATAAACERLANLYARQSDLYVGDLRITKSQISVAYRKQAAEMRKLAATVSTTPIPYGGGTSLADKSLDENNPDVPKRFRLGQDDFPGVDEKNNTLNNARGNPWW